MELDPEEQQIVELLTKLKNQKGGAYPKKMLASRRQAFLSQMAGIGAGLGIGAELKTVAKAHKTGSALHASSFSVSSLVETLLVVAIVVQAGVIAYTYRDRIEDFINSLSGITTPTATSIPITGSPIPGVVVSNTPVVTETPIETPTATTTSISSDTTSSDSTNGSNSIQNAAATETPQPTKDNPGNHFGQTPKPTQDNSNNNSSGGSSGTGNGGGNSGGNGNGNGNGNGKKP